MSKHWLVILLFISFAFNLAVIGSFIYLRLTMGPPPPPPMEDGRGPHRYRHDDSLRFKDSEEVNKLRDQFRETKQELMSELAKDPINEARLNSIVDSSLVIQTKLERELGTSLIKLRKSMTPAEAKEFFTKRMDNIQNMHNRRQHQFRRYRRN